MTTETGSVFETLGCLEYRMMDNVQKHSNPDFSNRISKQFAVKLVRAFVNRTPACTY
jgi:hypothetical protein